MNFEDYITEASKDELELYNIIQTLKKDSAPFIKELQKSGKELLWRGTRGHSKGLTKINPRKDRAPTDTPEQIHDELNRRFKKRFGWEVRSEGVFATSSSMTAGDYGIPYMFFPIGKCQYIYNPRVEDLWRELEGDYADILNVYDEGGVDNYEGDWGEAYEFDYGEGASGSWYYEGGDTGEVDIDSAVDAAAEAEGYDPEEINSSDLEWVPDVTWEDFKTDQWEEVKDEAEGQLDTLISEYRKDNLGLAIKKKVELQFKCKSYYLVDQKYQYAVERHLLHGKPLEKPK